MAGRAQVKFTDFSNETRSFSIPGVFVTAANHDAQLALVTDLLDAIRDVVYDSVVEYQLVARQTDIADGPATDGEGQVEKTWLVKGHYSTDSSIKRSFRIYCANLDASWMTAGTNDMDLASTEGAALKAAIEAYWKEDAGVNAMVVETITFTKA